MQETQRRPQAVCLKTLWACVLAYVELSGAMDMLGISMHAELVRCKEAAAVGHGTRSRIKYNLGKDA